MLFFTMKNSIGLENTISELSQDKGYYLVFDSDKFKQNSEINSDVSLLLFFPKKYCSAQIDIELLFLKRMYEEYPNKIILNNNYTDYNISTMIYEKGIRKTSVDYVNTDLEVPVFFLVHENGSILYQYISQFDDIKETNDFYNKMSLILSL